MVRVLHKAPYFSVWWSFVRVNFFPRLPSLTQACLRLARLARVVERIVVRGTRVESLDPPHVPRLHLDDAAPLPKRSFEEPTALALTLPLLRSNVIFDRLVKDEKFLHQHGYSLKIARDNS